MTPEQPAPVDAANGLLSEVPAQFTTALMQTPHGQRLALTIRTASTTLTVLLGAADARSWAGHITGAADQMSSAGLIVAGPGTNGAMNGHYAVPHDTADRQPAARTKRLVPDQGPG